MVTLQNVIHKQKDRTTLYSAQMKATEQYFPVVLFINDKHYHRKVLLSGFHLNGPNTLGFHPQIKDVRAPFTA